MDLIPQNFSAFILKKRFVIPLVLSVVLLLTILFQSVYSILSYDNIYGGVYINGIHVGTLSTDNAYALMKTRIQQNYPDSMIELKCNGASVKFKIKDIGVNYILDRAIDNAYLVGRKGSMFSRIASIANAKRYGKIVSLPFTYDKSAANAIINELYSGVFRPVKEADIIIDDKNATVVSGSKGYSFDKSQVLNSIEQHISAGSGGVIEIPLIITNPSELTVDGLYNKVYCLPADAVYKKEGSEFLIIPHTIGKDIERAVAADALSSIAGKEGATATIPITISMPNVLESYLSSTLFRDTLHSASTSFNAGNVNRSHNIKLASDKINGTILLPGEVFSYNEVVGPRTSELGYKAAAAYLAGKVVDSIGGGICQVSSTIYNAVLFSDLEVVERTNHHFAVSYVLLGHDATVSYEQVDFKFKNSTAFPIKLLSQVSGGKITVSIMGTNQNPQKTVQTRIDVRQTLAFGENVTYDSTLPEGTRKVTSSGANGYIADVYKIIKQDGIVVSEKLLSKNHYYPLKQEVRVGTKKLSEPNQPASELPAPEPEVPALLNETVPEIPYNSVNQLEN